MRRTTAGVITATLMLPLAGCGGADSTESTATLEQQRVDLQSAARNLIAAAEERLTGELGQFTGRFEGCTSAFPDSYEDYRYAVQAAVAFDVDGTTDVTGTLEQVFEEVGFEVTEPAKTTELGPMTIGERDGTVARSYVYPEGDSGLAINIEGPCVDVPSEDGAAWQDREIDKALP